MNRRTNLPFIISLVGLIGTLFWTGFVKFSPGDVRETAQLIGLHPAFHWITAIIDPVILCKLIGTLEIIAAFAIIAGNFIPEFGLAGCLLSLFIFFCEVIVLLFECGTLVKTDGFWNPTSNVILLFKNITILGNCLFVLLQFYLPHKRMPYGKL